MATYDVLIKRYASGVWNIIYPKTTAENIISGTLDAARIPSLDASKIGAGSFHVDRIPSLDASKIGTGSFHVDRIPSLDASKIGSGVIDVSRLPSIGLTNVMVTTSTLAAYLTTVQYSLNVDDIQEGDVIVCTTVPATYIHNGGSAGTVADFTILATPTDLVTSVAGRTGAVVLTKSDVSLGNVDNTADTAKPVSTAQQTALNLKANKVTITGATKPKITYNADGIVTAGADLLAADIPVLDTAKITTGNFAISRITDLQTTLDNKALYVVLCSEANLASAIPTPQTAQVAYVTA